jgi:hypothetical protein
MKQEIINFAKKNLPEASFKANKNTIDHVVGLYPNLDVITLLTGVFDNKMSNDRDLGWVLSNNGFSRGEIDEIIKVVTETKNIYTKENFPHLKHKELFTMRVKNMEKCSTEAQTVFCAKILTQAHYLFQTKTKALENFHPLFFYACGALDKCHKQIKKKLFDILLKQEDLMIDLKDVI